MPTEKKINFANENVRSHGFIGVYFQTEKQRKTMVAFSMLLLL